MITLLFFFAAVLTGLAALVIVLTTGSAGGYEGEPVRVRSERR